MDALWLAMRSAGLDHVLAVAAGAAAALLAVQLLRSRRHAARVRDLASRAATLGAGEPAAPPGEPPAGRDAIAELARALHAAEQRLAEERSARGKLLARALDEVKRPLGLLATSLDLALRRRPEVPELTAALRDAQREAARIARLAERIVTLESAARSAQRAPVDLAALARSVVHVAEPAAAQRGLSLRLEAPGPVPLQGDAAALTQALAELIANAVQASRFGGAVVVKVTREGALARAAVSDEGPGIPPERRAEVFEPFGRGPHGWSPAGMGLAIVREVARGHGGTVAIAETERGATVVLEVPAG